MTTRPHVNSLKAAMHGMKQDATLPPETLATVVPLKPASEAGKPRLVAPSRDGKRQIAGHFDPLVAKQLRLMAAEQDASIQDLLEEALNDLFRKHGKSAVA